MRIFLTRKYCLAVAALLFLAGACGGGVSVITSQSDTDNDSSGYEGTVAVRAELESGVDRTKRGLFPATAHQTTGETSTDLPADAEQSDTPTRALSFSSTALEITSAHMYSNVFSIDLPESIDCAAYNRFAAGVSASAPLRGVCDGTMGGATVRFIGGFDFNLVAGTAPPELTSVVLPPGMYRNLQLTLDNSTDRSVSVQGEFKQGGLPVTVAVTLAYVAPLTLSAGTGLEVSAGGEIVLTLDGEQWFMNLDSSLSRCLNTQPDPTTGVAIDLTENSDLPASCAEVFSTLRDNLPGAARFRTSDSVP